MAAFGRCDGGRSAGFDGAAAVGTSPCSDARVGVGGAAGIILGDDRYADNSVICASVSDDTVALSCTWMRAQSLRAVSYEMP